MGGAPTSHPQTNEIAPLAAKITPAPKVLPNRSDMTPPANTPTIPVMNMKPDQVAARTAASPGSFPL